MTFVGNYWDGKNMTYIQSFCQTTFLILTSIAFILLCASVGLALVISFIKRKLFLSNRESSLQTYTLLESSANQINSDQTLKSKILDGLSLGLFWLGISYNQSFSPYSFISPISVILILSSIGLAIVVSFMNRKNLKKINESRIQSTTLFEGSFAIFNEEYPLIQKILDGLSIGFFWLGLNCIFLIFPIFSGFEVIKRFTATVYSTLTYILGLFYQLWRMSNYQNQKYEFIQKVFLRFQLLIYVFAAYALPYAFDKSCICSYSSGYGIPIIMDLKFSTDFSRGFQFGRVCKDGQICHFYATLPQDTMHEVIFNVHVGQDIDSVVIELECQEFPFPKDIELRGQRRIYACLFRNLLSGTDYEVIVYHQDQILKNTTYRTIPSRNNDNPLVILFGGDYGYQEMGKQIARKVVTVDPHIILIGGDVTYDNGHIHCYYSNDLFLNIFEEQFAYMGRVVPFILSVGNHDVGFNDYANYNISVSNEKGPLYFILFPQMQVNGMIPDTKDRVTYNYHLIQNILLFGLDSGFLYTHEQQVPFVKNISEQYADFARIAHFHVPLYPTCFPNASSMEHWENLVYARKHWVQLFDELDFKAVFENHVHQFKRTYPLRKGLKSQFGTIYFGDGSMGVTVDQCDEQYQTFQKGGAFEGQFETVLTENSEHFWVLTADKYGKVRYEARKPNYDVIPNSQAEQYLFISLDDL